MFTELQELSASHDGSEHSFNNTDDIEVIEDTKEVSQPTQVVTDINTMEYLTDSTVPPGWSYRGELAQGKRFSLRSPCGQVYPSRSGAIPQMISSGSCSLEELSLMRRLLRHEGWADREDIPSGWKVKARAGTSGYQFLEQGGKRFHSAKQALEFVLKHRKYYSQTDIEKLYNLARKGNSQSKCVVPQLDVSIDKIPAPSERQKIQNQSQIPQESQLEPNYNGRQIHDSVPIRPSSSQSLVNSTGNAKDRTQSFPLSEPPTNQVQVSQQDVHQPKDYSQNHRPKIAPLTSNQQINFTQHSQVIPQQFNGHIIGSTTQTQTPFIVQSPTFFLSNPQLSKPVFILPKHQQIDIRQKYAEPQKKKAIQRDWKVDGSIYPPGWKYSEIFSNGKKLFDRVMSDTGVKFLSKRAALAFMITNNFPAEDLDKLHRAIERDGWRVSPSLPPLWRHKRTSKGLELSSPDGRHLRSRDMAIKMLEETQDGSEVHSAAIELIRNFRDI